MNLTVTMPAEGDNEYDENPEMVHIEFNDVAGWEIIDDYFIVHKVDGTLQAIKKYKILKFFTSN